MAEQDKARRHEPDRAAAASRALSPVIRSRSDQIGARRAVGVQGAGVVAPSPPNGPDGSLTPRIPYRVGTGTGGYGCSLFAGRRASAAAERGAASCGWAAAEGGASSGRAGPRPEPSASSDER
jgi:hypothetical protein